MNPHSVPRIPDFPLFEPCFLMELLCVSVLAVHRPEHHPQGAPVGRDSVRRDLERRRERDRRHGHRLHTEVLLHGRLHRVDVDRRQLPARPLQRPALGVPDDGRRRPPLRAVPRRDIAPAGAAALADRLLPSDSRLGRVDGRPRVRRVRRGAPRGVRRPREVEAGAVRADLRRGLLRLRLQPLARHDGADEDVLAGDRAADEGADAVRELRRRLLLLDNDVPARLPLLHRRGARQLLDRRAEGVDAPRVCTTSNVMNWFHLLDDIGKHPMALALLPVVLGITITATRYALKISGTLISPTPRWGPPGRGPKLARIKFDPSHDLHYRSIVQQCPHSCLLYSNGLKKERKYWALRKRVAEGDSAGPSRTPSTAPSDDRQQDNRE